jgi:branched-subunit amino acid transport protein
MTDLAAVVVVGLGTFLSRAVFILGLANRRIPGSVLTALEYVGPATLAALVVSLLTADGQVMVGWAETAGLAAAIGCGLRTRNLTLILLAGMTAYWSVHALS